MTQFWLSLCDILLFIIVTTTATKNVGFQTQQGIIYGRKTQYSIEYLGYDETIISFITFVVIVP
jgi:hypothetical protein